jgi:predicted nucleic acid-binding protein
VIASLDSSTILRIILGQSNALKKWRSITQGVASALVEVECLGTLDRLRLAEGLEDAEIAIRHEATFPLLEAIEVVELTRSVLARASQPMPTPLGTLDAIHLATALLWKDRNGHDLVMATHDEALATASHASGLRVVGIQVSA